MGPSSSKLTVHPIILYAINPGYKCLQYVKWYNEHIAPTVDTVDIESNTGNFIITYGKHSVRAPCNVLWWSWNICGQWLQRVLYKHLKSANGNVRSPRIKWRTNHQTHTPSTSFMTACGFLKLILRLMMQGCQNLLAISAVASFLLYKKFLGL